MSVGRATSSRVDAPPWVDRVVGRADVPLVGRGVELGLLERALEEATRGHPRLVLVTGDAGIGKSSLVDRFIRDQTVARCLIGRCFGLVSSDLPYSPFVQAFRPLRGSDLLHGLLLADLVEPAGSDLASVEAAPSSPFRWEKSRLFEGVLGLVADLAARQPLLIVLEDLHWADQGTLDLLVFLAGNLVSERVLVVATMRGDEPVAPPWLITAVQRLTHLDVVETLEVAGLDASDALALARAGSRLEEAVLQSLVERAEGNPLFLIELVRAAARSPAVTVPRRLRDLVAQRRAVLSEDARRVVDLLAVAAAPVRSAVLLAALEGEVPDPLASVREGFEAHLVVTDDAANLLLPHALIGHALYETLSPPERAHWHLRLADALASVRDGAPRPKDLPAVLAFHYERGGRLDAVPEPLVRAALQATESCAFGEAVRAWERALELERVVPAAFEPTGMDRVEMLRHLGRALKFGATPERGVAALEEALRLLPDGDQRTPLVQEQLARQCFDLGRADEARAVIRTASDRAEGAPAPVRARVESTHAALLMLAGEYAESRDRCAVALALEADGEPTWERIQALSVLGVDLVNLGDPEGAVRALQEAIRLSRDGGDPEPLLNCYVNYTYVLEAIGRYGDTVATADEGIELADRVGLGLVAGTQLRANKASALIACGRVREARQVLEAVHSAAVPRASSRTYVQVRLAEVDITRGAWDDARRRMASLAADVDGLDVSSRGQLRLTQVQLALATGHPELAVGVAQDELGGAGGIDPTIGLQLCALTLRALGMIAERRPAVRAEPAWRRQLEECLQVADRLRGEGQLQPSIDMDDLCRLEHDAALGAETPGAWTDLGERLRSHEARGWAAYAFHREALLQLAAGSREAAARPLRSAWELLQEDGDVALRGQVEELSRRSRLQVDAPSSPPEREHPFGLTAREQEVFAMVREGRTNRQIARALQIAERTVAVHISHILGKIGARSRTEAVVIALKAGQGIEDGHD